MEIIGKLERILPMQTGEGKNGTWNKQLFVIETQEQFPKLACFMLWGDKTGLLNQYQIGQMIRVSFNVESREHNERWYTDLRAWKLEAADGAPAVSPQNYQPQQATPNSPTPINDMTFSASGADDLPF